VIRGLSGPISHLRGRDESDALTVRKYGKGRGDELDPVLSTTNTIWAALELNSDTCAFTFPLEAHQTEENLR
jgi:hypothetical protein